MFGINLLLINKFKLSLKITLFKIYLKCRYYIFSFRKPLKIGFLRLYNEENTIIPCLMSVIDSFDKIVLIYSRIDDSSLELVKDFIKSNHYGDKFIISQYPYEVYKPNTSDYYKPFKWENTLAAYYQYGYDICTNLLRCRNGFIAKIDADQIYINDCFNEIDNLMKKNKYTIIVDSFGGYNGYVNKEQMSYRIQNHPERGCLNGFAGDSLCIPAIFCNMIKFDMSITEDHAYEITKFPWFFWKMFEKYDKHMWFHFNQKKTNPEWLQPLTPIQYQEYKEKVFPLIEKSKSNYVNLEIIKS